LMVGLVEMNQSYTAKRKTPCLIERSAVVSLDIVFPLAFYSGSVLISPASHRKRNRHTLMITQLKCPAGNTIMPTYFMLGLNPMHKQGCLERLSAASLRPPLWSPCLHGEGRWMKAFSFYKSKRDFVINHPSWI
jgi:hypothetical protein